MRFNDLSALPPVGSLAELDALVGEHVTDETPESFWEDLHGHFQFDSIEQARQALADPVYQHFLPAVDWEKTEFREVKVYRGYSRDLLVAWQLVERLSPAFPAVIRRELGKWNVRFGENTPGVARNAPVAICVAALYAMGVMVRVDCDRLDWQSQQAAGKVDEDEENASEEPAD